MLKRSYIAAFILVGLAGCSSTGPMFGGGSESQPVGGGGGSATAESGGTIDTGGLAVYLEMMQRLIDGDALTRAEAFNDARDAAEFAPTTTNRLRYALALSVPGHDGSDAQAATERLRTLIAAGDTLLPEERTLATIQLRQAEQLVILQSSSAEVQQRLESSLAAADAENAERIRGLQAENQRLQTELNDTTATLEAITSIERSISEREDNED